MADKPSRGTDRLQRKAGSRHARESGRPAGDQSSRTAGENRDYDETGESKNQGHGHPREERKSTGRG